MTSHARQATKIVASNTGYARGSIFLPYLDYGTNFILFFLTPKENPIPQR